HFCSSLDQNAPLILGISMLLLIDTRVGILRTLNTELKRGLVSVSIFAKTAFGYCCATVAKCGAIILQGPHHSAQRSIRIGKSLWVTNWLKFCSFNSIGANGIRA